MLHLFILFSRISMAEIGLEKSELDQEEETKGDSLKVKLALLCLGVFISLSLLEVGVRVFNKLNVPVVWRDRPSRWYVPEGTVDNRDFYYPPEKAEGVFRVIVVGDSFTYGGKGHFDDTFPKRLERMLNLNEHQRKVEVLNWGVPGYSTAQEYELVKKAVDSYHPDLIILEVTLNDPELQPYGATHHPRKKGKFKVFLERNWQTYQLVSSRISATILDKQYIQYYQDLFNHPDTWHHFSGAVKHIAHLTKERNVPTVAMIFPLFSHPLNEKYPYADITNKAIAEFELNEFPILNLFPYFKNIPPQRLQAIPGVDSHPNEIADRIATDALYSWLKKQKLLPEDVVIKKAYKNGRILRNPVPITREEFELRKHKKDHKPEKVMQDTVL